MMPKKRVRKTAKPLPSALTVATRFEPDHRSEPQPATLAAAADGSPPSSAPCLASAPPSPVPAATPRPAPEPPPTAPPAQPPIASDEVSATFVFYDSHATHVSVCGEFNEWLPEDAPMTRQDEGRWVRTVALRPGRYQYKFVVDGQWVPDPNAPEQVPNEFGSVNSLITVRAGSPSV